MRQYLNHIRLSPFCYHTYSGIVSATGRDACPCGWVSRKPTPGEWYRKNRVDYPEDDTDAHPEPEGLGRACEVGDAEKGR